MSFSRRTSQSYSRKKINTGTEEKAGVVAAAWGGLILHQDELKNGMNKIIKYWLPVLLATTNQTTPNCNPTKMDVIPITVLQIILAAKWLVWHSSMSLKHQRRPLPSLLYLSLPCSQWTSVCVWTMRTIQDPEINGRVTRDRREAKVHVLEANREDFQF